MKVTVATIPKNKLEEVRVGIDEFKGYDLVSLRVWTDPYAGTERVPTKRGLSVSVRLLPALMAALQEAEAAAREAGLFDEDEQEAA